jgi:hypothetical protein
MAARAPRTPHGGTVSDNQKFPNELVVAMQSGCNPGHPLTPTFCLDIAPTLSLESPYPTVRKARYRLVEDKPNPPPKSGQGDEWEWLEPLRLVLADMPLGTVGPRQLASAIDEHCKRVVDARLATLGLLPSKGKP